MKLSKKLNTRLICRGPIWDPGRSTIAKMLTVLVFIFLVLSLQHNIIFGQDVVNLVVLPPEIEDFPVLSVSFEITNLPNQPVPNIDIEQLTLFENDRQVPILSYEQVETGVHFALAINGGREFDIRDANGVSPYQTMSSEILGWASSRTFSPDDAWSFVTNEGIAIHNTNSNRSWITAVDTYQPDFRKLVPRTDALEKSIQMLKDWTVSFGVDKALLYITVPPSPDQITSIRTLTQEALTAGIHISVWMIGDGYYLTNDQGGALIDLASLSGGQFFHFTGTETIPDPELNISYLGNYFSLTYQSQLRQTGTYPLSLTIDLPDGPVAGESTPFYIEVSPPKPVLLSPPTTITRQALSNVPDPMARLEPQIIALEFIVEFPDGRPREIEESRLFIDGDLSNVNTTPPLNRMDWDLSSITESGQHTIQIEVKDTLGLSSRTIELPVVVEVMSTSPSAADILPRQQTGLLISGAIFLAALIILFVWGFRQIIRSPRVLSVRQNLINRFKKSRNNPVIDNLHQSITYATLIPLNEIFDMNRDQTLPRIKQTNTILGSDPTRAGLVLNEEGISPIHAQISLRHNKFWINDLGSSDGTWKNYERLGLKPVVLEPGDIVHFGNIGFRFTIIESVNPPSVQVQKFEPLS